MSCSFSSLSVTSPTLELILQPFCRFTYVTAHSSILPLLHLCHSSFSNPSFTSPTSQALHLIHLANRPCSYLMCPLFYSSKYGNPTILQRTEESNLDASDNFNRVMGLQLYPVWRPILTNMKCHISPSSSSVYNFVLTSWCLDPIYMYMFIVFLAIQTAG